MKPRQTEGFSFAPLDPSKDAEAESPETPLDTLFRLVPVAPHAVLRNVAFSLLLLEDPARVEVLWRKALAVVWVHELKERAATLNPRKARLFACDCAERVHFLFERSFPSDTRLKEVLQTARRFANGKASEEERGQAHVQALRLAQWAGTLATTGVTRDAFYTPQLAARAVGYASHLRPNAFQAAVHALAALRTRSDGENMYWRFEVGGFSPEGDLRAQGYEIEWQRTRLERYLRAPRRKAAPPE